MDTLAKCVPKPKILPQRQKAMTCILGMRCADGIILGSDREINQSISKYGKSKIVKRTTWGETPYFLACTSNDMGNANQWITAIKRAIKGAEQGELEETTVNGKTEKISITRAVKNVYEQMLGTPQGAEAQTSFIWVLRHGGGYRLIHLTEGSSDSISPWAINGSGFHHTVGLMSELYRKNMTLTEGAVLAAYLLKVAKMRASGVGDPSEILLLRHNGETSMLDYSYVESLESDFWEMHKVFQSQISAKLASQTDTRIISTEEIDELSD